MRIEYFEEVGSTNDEILRYIDGGEDIILCARRQTGGKGTKGRSFLSGEGGVYLTALTFYRNFPAKDAFFVMTRAAVAVCRTAEFFGAKPSVKWPNDVYLGNKKLAGISIENLFSGGYLVRSVVGIGLNVNNDLAGVDDIAVRLSDVVGAVSTERVRDKLIEAYQKESNFEDYSRYVRLGEMQILEYGKQYTAIARRVLSDGRLEVERNGEILALSAAEVSLRIANK